MKIDTLGKWQQSIQCMKLNSLQSLLIAYMLGMASILVPVWLLEDLKPYDAPLFPMLRTGLEGISSYSFALLFMSGFVVRILSASASWIIGLGCMALFPIAAICELIEDPTSHNMFPMELILYAFYAIPAAIGAYAAQSFGHLVCNRTTTTHS